MKMIASFSLVQLFFYTSFFFLPLLFSHANSQLNVEEQSVLLSLKKHWQNPPPLSHWIPSNSSSHCSWPEVTCTDGSVTHISFQNLNISGTVPPNICDLRNLTAIDLSFNYFVSEFPKAIYNCSRLQHLNLSQNFFGGTVPNDIHRMSRLRELDLGANNFTGNIPASLGRLTELRVLQLYMCQFTGSFPPEMGNLFNLEVLVLAYNTRMTQAELPSSYTKLKKLKFLWATSTNLVGEIPDTIGEMKALERLDLCKNNLSGKIPNSLFMLKNLRIVYLYKNKLTGEIPQVVKALNMEVIDLSENNLRGAIPDDFGKLSNLSGLALFFNQLSGIIPESIGNLPRLINFNLFNNNLSGMLPRNLGRYSMLEEFQVASNMLMGELPKHLCDNGRLVGVVAFDNNLSGELPKLLGNCSRMTFIDVHNNRLSGNIPGGLWTSVNLGILILNNNSFTGELPERLSPSLRRLELNFNNFAGEIPAGMSSWKNLQVLKASNNLLNGPIPQELTSLSRLSTLILDHNRLSGPFPRDIISWKSLNILNLRQNEISGEIPRGLGSLPGLTDLDLSGNQLSGLIPDNLAFLKLTSFNLSSNHLTGKIPRGFENKEYASSFLNNSGLCASSPYVDIDSCNFKPKSLSKTSTRLLVWIMVLVVAVPGLLVSFFLVRIKRKTKHCLDVVGELNSFQKLNFAKSDILLGLTDENVIGYGGSGKVFRVAINSPCDIITVKKIWNSKKLEQKLEKEFLTEVEILGSIRHSNIVKLMGYISSGRSKLLVYEYLENRSLDLWLHEKNGASVELDWPKRMQIAIGAARGLSYMHHDCSPPIVHRDVKSSNILLDSEFNAKIGDFGLAKILMKQGESATISSVAGSFGYIAPEYVHTTRVNEKIDVFSFGVVLLELATGRKATDGDEHTSLAEWAWRYIQEGNSLVDALDEDVKELEYLDEMCRVFKLGVHCTGTSPSTRPSMKEVLEILLRCGQPLGFGDKHATNGYDAFAHLKISKGEKVSEKDFASLEFIV